MAESKRIFNKAKMNRDIDDRLLPEGEYRYALNVNIGESEGGDIGAVENLKGNHQVGATDGGTTIGVVRDPNTDRIYWFNKGDQFDTIYEYGPDDDGVVGVRPILRDSVSRTNVQPTCAPNFGVPVQMLPDDVIDRPPLDSFPTAPQGYCSISGRPNSFERADGSAYTPGFDFPMDSICEAVPPPSSNLSVSVANVTRQTGTGDITLTAVASDATGAVTFEWFSDSARTTSLNTGSTTTVTDPGSAQAITRYVTATDTVTSANAQGDAVFTSDPTFSYTVNHSGSFAGATLMPTAASQTFTGTAPLAIDFISQQVLGDNMQWTLGGIPTAAATNPDGLTFTQSTGAAQTDNLQARLMGSVSAGGSASIAWSGGVTETIVTPTTIAASLALSGSFDSSVANMILTYSISGSGIVTPTGPMIGGLTITGAANGQAFTGLTVTDSGIANPSITDFGGGTGYHASYSFQLFSPGWTTRSPIFNTGTPQEITINSIAVSLTGPAGYVNPTFTTFAANGGTHTIPATYTSE